jgi:hypothetical protein
MSLFEEKPLQGEPGREKFEEELEKIRERTWEKKKPPVKEEKKDTSIFGGKSFIQRGTLRGRLKKPDVWEKTHVPEKEREKWEKSDFDVKKYGPLIDKKDAEKAIKDLFKEKGKTPDIHERFEIDRKIQEYKKIFGI